MVIPYNDGGAGMGVGVLVGGGGPFSTFTIATHLAIGSQECDPDGIDLQDRRDIGRVIVRSKVGQVMQAPIQGAQGQWADVQVL